MSDTRSPLLIFTDLDGSLLDHASYDHAPADGWLARLSRAQVPVIINSSKTAAEIAPLQLELALTGPFIAENGGSIHLPPHWRNDGDDGQRVDRHGWGLELTGASYQRIGEVLEQLRASEGLAFRGFNDMALEEVMSLTGLGEQGASLARRREATEPLVWEDSDEALKRFTTLLGEAGLALTRGGRFYHVMGEGSGKGQAIDWLVARYQQLYGVRPRTIGLGDGPNDLPMLQAVDEAVLIRGEHDIEIDVEGIGSLYTTKTKGPEGWSEGLDHWLAAWQGDAP
ncbi:HAD-IIB family hydrolase [Kushneria aurantia]|uniref:HAD-IIB family hydrolase n=1 Tax=Kushneria aurantia TaxID=504092 RepID=A0ABV6FZP1_9GAMM|nr:HAD-IIB family hydrolase [Kushneria aurantia]